MAKKGYSREGLFGTIHYDENGNKIGESRPGLFGTNTMMQMERKLDIVIQVYLERTIMTIK